MKTQPTYHEVLSKYGQWVANNFLHNQRTRFASGVIDSLKTDRAALKCALRFFRQQFPNRRGEKK